MTDQQEVQAAPALGSYDPGTNLELESFHQMILRDDADKADEYVDRSKLEFVAGITEDYIHQIIQEDDTGMFGNQEADVVQAWKDDHTYGFSDLSFRRFCRRIKVHPGFINTCPDFLVQNIVDHFLGVQGAGRILLRYRKKDGMKIIRGICGANYVPLDNKEVWEIVMPELLAAQQKLGIKIRVFKPTITDEYMHTRIIFEDNVDMGVGGREDPFNVGIHISNSEIGLTPVRMDLITFRLICTNGMISMADGRRLFQFKQEKADKKEFREALINRVNWAVENRNKPLESIQAAAVKRVSNPSRIIRRICNVHGVNQGIAISVLGEYEEGVGNKRYEDSRMDIINAFTRVAQTEPGEIGLKIEAVAGRVLVDESVWDETISDESVY